MHDIETTDKAVWQLRPFGGSATFFRCRRTFAIDFERSEVWDFGQIVQTPLLRFNPANDAKR
ncbi:hypothetical protein [Candidatus Phyllobacterium onerii]|uniref:hypothetical protein n=1 Tax=Candidatus Phyllobacterium onerii TaxID=3020828 RepID=UPI00232E30AA|nr:hypothetical protein [Phyllobacterium sp. IY22]